MRPSLFNLLPLLLLASLLNACSSTPSTVSAADPGLNISQYQTYNFMQALDTDGKAYQSLETTYLMDAVSREMAARGFTTSDQPDLLINFALETEEKIRSRSVPRAGVGFGHYDPVFDDVYYGGWGTTHETRIDQYTEGRLIIDLIDRDGRKMVWQGSTKGRLTKKDYENAKATLNEAVTEIFTQFPAQ